MASSNEGETSNETKECKQKPGVLDGDGPVVAYLHDLSPIKVSQRNNPYFDMTIQTSEGAYRAVCFSPEKHAKCTAKFQSSSPVKLSKYEIKRNLLTNEQEILINKRSKMDDPSADEIDFSRQLPSSQYEISFAVMSVEDVLDTANFTLVNVAGKITFEGDEETILAHGKTLRKQEATLYDDTASIRLVLWEQGIDEVVSGYEYQMRKALIKQHDGEKYITHNTRSTIQPTTARQDQGNQVGNEGSLKSVDCPAEGVLSINRLLSCTNCHATVAATADETVVKCIECGLSQLKNKCKERLVANVLFKDDTSATTLSLPNKKLKKMFKIYQKETNCQVKFGSIDDDVLTRILLTVRAKVVFDDKRKVVSIEKIPPV